jgi:hypothetical protein
LVKIRVTVNKYLGIPRHPTIPFNESMDFLWKVQ